MSRGGHSARDLVWLLAALMLPGPWMVAAARGGLELPAEVVAPMAGLAILATEYTWAKRAHRWSRERWRSTVESTKHKVATHRAERASRHPDGED